MRKLSIWDGLQEEADSSYERRLARAEIEMKYYVDQNVAPFVRQATGAEERKFRTDMVAPSLEEKVSTLVDLYGVDKDDLMNYTSALVNPTKPIGGKDESSKYADNDELPEPDAKTRVDETDPVLDPPGDAKSHDLNKDKQKAAKVTIREASPEDDGDWENKYFESLHFDGKERQILEYALDLATKKDDFDAPFSYEEVDRVLNKLLSHQDKKTGSVKTSAGAMDLEDLLMICKAYSGLGWAVIEQMESFLATDDLASANPAAVDMFKDFLSLVVDYTDGLATEEARMALDAIEGFRPEDF